MTCDEYQQHLSEFLDDELDDQEVRPLFQHLGTCDACWTYYRRIEALHTALAEEASAKGMKTGLGHSKSTGSAYRRDRPASPNWMNHRLSVTPASFLLGTLVAFMIGALLTLLLSSSGSAGMPATDDRWAGHPFQGANAYQLQSTWNTVTPPTGERR